MLSRKQNFLDLQKNFAYTDNKNVSLTRWNQPLTLKTKREIPVRKPSVTLYENVHPDTSTLQLGPVKGVIRKEVKNPGLNQLMRMIENGKEAEKAEKEEKKREERESQHRTARYMEECRNQIKKNPTDSYHDGVDVFGSLIHMHSAEWLSNPKIEYRYFCFRYMDYIRHVSLPHDIPMNSDYESVLIEFRVLPHIEFIVRNTIVKLGDGWSHTVVCGSKNHHFIKDVCEGISPRIKVIPTQYDNLTPSKYSRFVSSLYFWNLLNGKKILIYQEDTCIFKTNWHDFVRFDYIGAPWPKNQNDNANQVGNGGLSLRTKQCMIDVIDRISLYDTQYASSTLEYMRNTGSTIPPEDVYFSKNMLDWGIGTVADWDSAHQFSSESIPNLDSWGGHNFWLQNPAWKKRLYKNVVIQVKPNYDFGYIEHRGGWGFVLDHLRNLDFFNRDAEVEFYDVADFSLDKITKTSKEGRPWAGIFHLTPKTPKHLDFLNIMRILENPDFHESLSHCVFMITLSDYLGKYIQEVLPSQFHVRVPPLYTIKHPVVTQGVPLFDWYTYVKNPDKKLLQIGQQLRKVTSLYTLKNVPAKYKKMWLTGLKDFERCKRVLREETEALDIKHVRLDEVEMHYTETFDEYDELLRKNVVYVEFYDATANNTILECIVRNTPLVVNRVAGVLEYLGPDYPLYFTNTNEVPCLLHDKHIRAAHEYLKRLDKREYEIDFFKKKLVSVVQETMSHME